jgi:hypothetical protein
MMKTLPEKPAVPAEHSALLVDSRTIMGGDSP